MTVHSVNTIVIRSLIYESCAINCNCQVRFMRLAPWFAEDQSVNDDKNRQADGKDNSDFRGYQRCGVHGVGVSSVWSKPYSHLKFNIISCIPIDFFPRRAYRSSVGILSSRPSEPEINLLRERIVEQEIISNTLTLIGGK